MRELAFSVTLKDCVVDIFKVGGNGGQKVNKTNSGVRITHPPSGAIGKCTETRSQLQNKKIAWRRMCETSEFKLWVKKELGQDEIVNAQVERAMWPVNIKTETIVDGEWSDHNEL